MSFAALIGSKFVLTRVLPALAVAGAIWWAYSWAYGRGEAAGAAQVQAAWDADRKAQDAATAALQAQARAREAADRKAAQEVQNALQERLVAADDLARDLARRLSAAYKANARQPSLPGPADPATGADSAPGVAPGDGALAAVTADVMAACARDSERLAGWQEWWGRVGNL